MNTPKTRDFSIYNTIRWGVCLLLGGFLAGCSLLTDSNEEERLAEAIQDFSIETDQDLYLVDENDPLEISYTYVNEGKQSIHPSSCLGVPSDNLKKLVDG